MKTSTETLKLPHTNTGNTEIEGDGGGVGEGRPPRDGEQQEQWQDAESGSVSGRPRQFESTVVLYNVAKRHNLGMIARSSTAFGVSEMILVGRKDFNAFGSHGAVSHLRFRHFHTLAQAHIHLKENDYDICGIEIEDGAAAVHTQPFRRNTAFLLGNEGSGLSQKEMSICDFLVYIPQYGSGTASLNVSVAASIVLHHFAVWAGLPERTREGQKFVVSEKLCRNQYPRNLCSEAPELVAAERLLRREYVARDWLEEEFDSEQAQTLDHTLCLKKPAVASSYDLSSLSVLFND